MQSPPEKSADNTKVNPSEHAVDDIKTAGLWFVDIPRTGSSSIRTELGRIYGGPYSKANISDVGFGFDAAKQDLPDHMTAPEVIKLIGRHAWDGLYTFSFVRNPWDRIHSIYQYRKRIALDIPDAMTFHDYLDEHAARFEKQPSGDEWYHGYLLTCTDFLLDQDGAIAVSKVARFESREADLREINKRLEQPISADLRLMATTTEHIPFQNHYNEKYRDLVGRIFQDDITMFNYTFNDAVSSPSTRILYESVRVQLARAERKLAEERKRINEIYVKVSNTVRQTSHKTLTPSLEQNQIIEIIEDISRKSLDHNLHLSKAKKDLTAERNKVDNIRLQLTELRHISDEREKRNAIEISSTQRELASIQNDLTSIQGELTSVRKNFALKNKQLEEACITLQEYFTTIVEQQYELRNLRRIICKAKQGGFKEWIFRLLSDHLCAKRLFYFFVTPFHVFNPHLMKTCDGVRMPKKQIHQFLPWIFDAKGGVESRTDNVVLSAIEKIPSRGVFIDVGAGTGYISLRVAKRSRKIRIHAIEPDRSMRRKLTKNILINRAKKITTHSWAITDRMGWCVIHEGCSHQCDDPEMLPQTTLTRFVASLGQHADLVNVDVNGNEHAVIRGARESCGMIKAWLVRTHDGESHQACVDELTIAGYMVTNGVWPGASGECGMLYARSP